MSSQEATVYLQTNLVVSERKMTINLKMRSAADVESAIQFLQHPHSRNFGISMQFLDPLDGPAAFLTNANFNSLLDELANVSVAVTELFVENAGSLFQHNTIDQRTLDRFCNIVGAKRDLAELTFHDASPSGFFSVAILAKILAKSKGSNLKKVFCCGRFGGTTEDLTALASALANHSTLQNVRLLFKLIPETLQTVANINPIVVALGTIPNLTTLGLTTWAPPPSPDDRNAANHSELAGFFSYFRWKRLVCYSRLECLSLGNETTRLVDALAALPSTTSIRCLHVRGAVREDEFQQLAELVRTNRSVRSLTIVFEPAFEPSKSLLEAFGENSTIYDLKLQFKWQRLCTNGLIETVESMLETKNRTLTTFSFMDPPPSPTPAWERIKLYLKANQHGRKRLLQNPDKSRSLWVATLARDTGDLDFLFYFLLLNPSLCDVERIRNGLEKARKQRREETTI